jgi:hypothetical protein
MHFVHGVELPLSVGRGDGNGPCSRMVRGSVKPDSGKVTLRR